MELSLSQAVELSLKKVKIICTLAFVLTQSACYFIGGDGPDPRNIPHVDQVYIERDSLNLKGSSLDRVQKIFLKDSQGSYEYQVQGQSFNDLSSSAKSAFSLVLGRTYDLIVSSADAQEVSQVTLSLNGSLAGLVYGNLYLPQGKLGVGNAWNSLLAAPTSLAHIVSSVGGGPTEGLTVQTLTSPTQTNFASFFSGAATNEAGFIQFGPASVPAGSAKFFIGSSSNPRAFAVSDNGNVYVNGGTLQGNPITATPLYLGNSSVSGTLAVTGNTTLSSNLSIAGSSTSSGYIYSYTTSNSSGNLGFTLQGTVTSGGVSTPINRFQIGTLGPDSLNGTDDFVIRSYPDPSPTPSVAGNPYPSSIDALVINRNTGMPTFTTIKTPTNSPNPSPSPSSVAKFRYISDLAQTPPAIFSCDLTRSGLSCSSDKRLKKEIHPISGALDKVLAVDGVTYRWKLESEGKKEIGFIAQDFEKVVPELVSVDSETTYKQVSYAPYVAILNQALKELYHKLFSSSGELEKLRKRAEEQALLIENLDKKLKTLEEKLGSLEKSRTSQRLPHSKSRSL